MLASRRRAVNRQDLSIKKSIEEPYLYQQRERGQWGLLILGGEMNYSQNENTRHP
jgi:hypothetical protein